MPVVTFEASDLRRLVGREVATDELARRMPMLGGDLDKVEGDRITIEWFPNRPDLLVLEGTGRALRAFLDVRPGLPKYPVAPARTDLRVDPSVQAVRPHAALCFVRGVPFDDAYVQAVIDAQEKLTFSPGRRRRKVAIGVHDASGVQGPFRYTVAGPAEHAFVPLGEARRMTPAEVVRDHPKGQEYGPLLPPGRYPVFLDGRGEVLSLPPVINAQRTAVTAATRDLLLDVTGTDAKAVRQTIALLASCFAERGGTIEAVTVHDASGAWSCPDLRPTEHVLHTDDVAELLGLEWDGEHTARCLRRMGHDATAFGNKVQVHVAAWRQDILHPVDLIEDVGIGHGFDQFPGELPKLVTYGGRLRLQDTEDRLRTLFVGLGFLEARTLTLSDHRQQATAWGRAAEPAVTLLNPVLEEQAILRGRLVPSLLHVLAANRHRPLPQRLAEVGYVVAPDGQGTWRNRLHLAAVDLGAKANLSDAKAAAEALARELALPLAIEASDLPGFIPGRAATLRLGAAEVGHFGELHPDTLVAFGLPAACWALELDVESLRPAAASHAAR